MAHKTEAVHNKVAGGGALAQMNVGPRKPKVVKLSSDCQGKSTEGHDTKGLFHMLSIC